MVSLLVSTGRARGAAPAAPCTGVRIVEASELAPIWRHAVDELREQTRRLAPAECVDVTLVLESDGDRVRLVASTVDGRRGERRVAAPASLVPIALGLIAPVPLAEDAPPADAPREAPSPAEVPPPDPPRPRPAAAPSLAPPSVQLAVSVSAGARMGFPTRVVMADLEARADVVAQGWLVLASARYAPFGTRTSGSSIPGYAYDEVALALGFGRRISLGEAALDVTVAPELVVMTEEGDVPIDGAGGTESEVRIDAAARLRLPFGARWKPSFTLDAELAPTTRPAVRVDAALPALPTWTLGLRAGAVGDLL